MKNTTINAIRQIIKLLEKQGQKYELTINNGVVKIVFNNGGQK